MALPLPLLVALVLAFGFDTAAGSPGPLTRSELSVRLGGTVGGVALVAALAFGVGRFVASGVHRRGRVTPALRRVYLLGVRGVDGLSLVAFGWAVHGLHWPQVVRAALGGGDPVLLDDVLTLLPFLLAQVLGWWGLHSGERLVRRGVPLGPGRYLSRKARQSFGMVLPVAAVVALGSDLVSRAAPGAASDPWGKPLSLALTGALVLALSPLLVRIAWPTRPLPPGPLRDRLELLARRVGFRCTDILVWDTNGMVINAGVTGSLPWFRYVLLTDALVDSLSPQEVAAVFGHEIGHIAHRHLVYFGLFILGSLGVFALAEGALQGMLTALPPPPGLDEAVWVALARDASSLLAIGTYFLLAFGFVSRRFERQADVFGCRVVSCGRADCPAHHDDLDTEPAAPAGGAPELCPVGIGVFVRALANVAYLNGMRPSARSWRHGSIVRRIAFLESLVGRPEAERTFQRGVSRMRRGVAAALALALVVAFWAGLLA